MGVRIYGGYRGLLVDYLPMLLWGIIVYLLVDGVLLIRNGYHMLCVNFSLSTRYSLVFIVKIVDKNLY